MSDSERNDSKKGNVQLVLYIAIIIAVLIITCLSLVLGLVLGRLIFKKPEPTLNSAVIQQKLTMCSELTTAELDYHGEVHFEEGTIEWIDKKSFTMEYDAHVEAGIDLSKATVYVEDNVINVILPEAEVQDVVIDANSLRFKQESFALLNWTEHEDTATAIAYAQNDAYEHVEENALVERAKEQAKDVVITLLRPIADNEEYPYEVNVKYAD